MIVLRNNLGYIEPKIRIREIEDLQSREKLDQIIDHLRGLEEEVKESYSLVRMQQRIQEIWGIFPESYNAQDRMTFVLNKYSIQDLEKIKRELPSYLQ